MHTTRRNLVSALAIAGAIALTASACSSAGDEQTGEGLNIVATTTQMGDVTREIAGDAASVTQLMEPGTSAHGFDPTPASLQALAGADAVVMNGAGLEEWLAPVLESSGFSGVLIDASEDVHLSGSHDHDHDHEEDGHDHDHDHDGEEGHDHEDGHDDHESEEGHDHTEGEDHTDDEGHDEDHDHEHGEGDPHLWTDPANVVVMAQTIGAELAELDAEQADTYETNTAAYVEQLEALQQWMGEAFESVPVEDRLLVTTHDSFHYLAEAYDIEVIGSLLPSFDDNAEVSAAAIDRLVEDIKASGAQAIFSDAQLPDDLANTIASETDVTVYSGEESLYTDSLGAEGTPGETYIGSQIHNTQLMVEAWGGAEPELPELLR